MLAEALGDAGSGSMNGLLEQQVGDFERFEFRRAKSSARPATASWWKWV